MNKNTISKSEQVGSQKQIKAKELHPDVVDGIRGLFVAELKDIYWAEKALLKAIPKMIKKATDSELIEALTGHLEDTQKHITRVENIFGLINVKLAAKKCEAMFGLIKEAEEIMKETEAGMVRDAGIISAVQKIEHYEIATYGTLRTFAYTIEENTTAGLLQETLNEEKAADVKLSEIAESYINAAAAVIEKPVIAAKNAKTKKK